MALNRNTANNAKSTIYTSKVLSTDLSFQVKTGTSTLFPAPPFRGVFEKKVGTVVTRREIVDCTGINYITDTLTISRAVEACPISDSATSQSQTAQEFASGDFFSVILTWKMYDEVVNKLDANGWLRIGLTANAIMNTTSGWVEQASAMTVDGVFASTDEILKRTAWGTWGRTPFSAIQSAIVAWSSQDNIAGEALALNDLCVYEYMHSSNLVSASWVGKYLQQKMGDVSGNTRLSMKIIGNGISASTLKLGLGKVAAPTDNLVVRIETDSAWVPSGTLVNANATANVAGTGLTTGIVDTTVTFGGAFTLANNTVYHVVIQRQNAVDPVNYYVIGTITKNVRMLKINSHNGTSWQTESAVKTFYMIYTGAYSRYIVKAINSLTELNWFDGINTAVVALWWAVALIREWITSWWSGLTEWAPYYVGSSAGIPTSTGTATAREIGYAVGTTKMYIKNPLYNPSNYEYSIDNFQYYLNEGAVQWGFLSHTFRVQARGRMVAWMAFSGGSWTLQVYVNNTLAVNNGWASTAFQVYPGDIVTFNFTPSTGAYGRQIGMQVILPPLCHAE
jgi:hypothetical protein